MKSLILVFIAFGTLSFLFYFSEPYLGYYNIPNIITSGIVVYFIFCLIHKTGNSLLQVDRTQLLLLLSFVCWFSAEALFGYYSGVLHTDPYPSIADIFYLAGYIFFTLLLWRLNKTYKIELSIFIQLISHLLPFFFLCVIYFSFHF